MTGRGESITASLWSRALRSLLRDRVAAVALAVVGLYLLTAIGVWFGLWGQNWSEVGDQFRASASAEHWAGTNAIGQDIFARAVYSTRTAFEIPAYNIASDGVIFD